MAGCRNLMSYARLVVTLAFFIRQSESNRIDVDSESKFILGGLFPIHRKEDNEHAPCGPSIKEKSIQRVEAMLYALDLIKEQKGFESISLGATILDTCASDSHAVEQSLNFLNEQNCRKPSPDSRRVTAVIGAGNSPVCQAVASILRLFKIPQVSYGSTSEELGNLHKYPYFFRVVPSDKFQIQAILDISKHLKWTYLSVVACKGEYGEMAIDKLKNMSRHSPFEDICIATVETLPRSPKPDDYDKVIDDLLLHREARAVVVFLSEDKLKHLLKATKRRNVSGHFLWLGSDSWGVKMYPVREQENLAEGAITIQSRRFPIQGFDTYFKSLNPRNNIRNPWFKTFWESHFNCSFLVNGINADGSAKRRPCRDDETFAESYKQEGSVPMVVDSVFVVAHALRNLCAHDVNCENLDRNSNIGALLKEHIAKVVFNSSQGNDILIKFDRKRSVQVNYTIFQFRKINNKKGGEYDYVHIGEWNPAKRLVLWDEPIWRIKGTEKHESRLQSVYSSPCKEGEEKLPNHHCQCCWSCRPCDGNLYLPHHHARCTLCPYGQVPTKNHTACRTPEKEYLGSDWSSAWVLIPTLFSCLGILFTISSAIVFAVFGETPVIKASGRELCYVIFVGIILCYGFTFIAMLEPKEMTCGVQRVGLGLGLTVCYASILTKTNRVSRIFNRRFSTTKRPAHISPRSQLMIVLCLVSIQLILSVMWLIISPPTVAYPQFHQISCGADHISIMLGLLYNMLLVILCTVYAYKTRNIPENFNEAKYISFTMYSSCIVWLTFVAVYNNQFSGFQVQSTVLCMSVSMSGTVVLLCLFFPKLYLVLLKPHKNVKHTDLSTHSGSGLESMTPVRYIRSGAPFNSLIPPTTCTCKLKPSPDLEDVNQ